MMKETAKDIARKVALAALEIKALKLQPEQPFSWASGYKMPIYNDNRLFLFYPEYRSLICSGFLALIKERKIDVDIVAATPSAGIPHGTLLADRLGKAFIYPRKSKKEYGMQNKLEGVPDPSMLQGKNVLLIEDLISTGGSSLEALETLRRAGAKVEFCMSIFSYGFQKAEDSFRQANAEYISLISFDFLLEVIWDSAYFNENQIELLREWKHSPFDWGGRFMKED